jgi:hypothetical protein
MKPLKLILKVIGGLVALILVLIIGAGVFIMLYVDKPLVEEQMRKALNRHAAIDSIDVGILSVLSGIEVKNVKISNFKTSKQLEELKGKPVPEGDIFASLKAFKFKVQLGPLLDKKFVLKELALYEPQINIVRAKSGLFNFSDLLIPGKLTPEEKAELLKKQEEEAKAAKEPKKPLSADDIPVAVSIGKIGMENGIVNFSDEQTGQKVQVYNATAKVYDIEIDPADLNKKDNVKLNVSMGIKTEGQTRGKSVESFDIKFSLNGNIIPFDKKTRILDPEIALKAGSPEGTMTGLQIFNKMDSIEQISKYCGKFSFLKKALVWKDAYTGIWYKGGTVKLDGGKLKTDDITLDFKGTHNIHSKSLDADIDMIVADSHKQTIKSGIQDNAGKLITGNLAKIVSPEKVADTAMKPLLNEKGQVYLKYKVTGTTVNPNTDLVHPKLPSLGDIIKNAGGDLTDMAADKAKALADQKAKEAEALAQKQADKQKKKAADSVKKKFKL